MNKVLDACQTAFLFLTLVQLSYSFPTNMAEIWIDRELFVVGCPLVNLLIFFWCLCSNIHALGIAFVTVSCDAL